MTVTPAAPAAQTAADFTPEQLELRERARRFVDEVLIPNEELAERAGGNIPDELKAADQERGGRGAAVGRAPRGGARRTGLVEGRVVPRRGAARALDERALVAHAGRLQRARRAARPSRSSAISSRRCAASCTTPTRSPRPRRAPTRRGSRPRRADDRRRLGDRRREVVRDLRRRRGRLHRDGERARRRREAADAVPRGPRARRHRDRRRPALQPHLSARPSRRSASPGSRWATTP